MKKPTKRYQVWVRDSEGYSLSEFDTVEEAVLMEKFTTEWYLSEAINHVSVSYNFYKPEKVEPPKETKK